LHPDVQRQLLGVVRDIGADVLLATHSSEIISEADPSEIVLIDKRKRTGDRLKNIAGVQQALEAIGSGQNIALTALAKSRRVLFVEGVGDFRLLRRFARKIDMQELSAGAEIIPLPSGGFGSWERVTILASGIAEALGAPLLIGAIYDQDYFCDEHVDFVKSALMENLEVARVLDRKEMENYLLIPDALDRAVERAVNARGKKLAKSFSSKALLEEITQPLKDDVLSQLMARKIEYFRGQKMDASVIYKVVPASFEERWRSLDARLHIVRNKIQDIYGVTLTDAKIIEAMHKTDLPADLVSLLNDLDNFRQTTPA
jgi:hypothetical protein